MKRLLMLLTIAFCLALVPAMGFAADAASQDSQDEQTAGEEDEGRGDVIEDEGEGDAPEDEGEGEDEGRGDVIDDEDAAGQSIMDTFPIGMPKADALAAGAKASNTAEAMVHSGSWLDAEWQSTLILEKDTLVTLVMKTALDHRTLAGVLGYLTENSYAVMNVTGVDGKNIPFAPLKAQGKSDEALSETLDKALEAFAEADKGSCVIALCLDETLNEMAEVIKKKGDEDALLEREKDTVLYMIQLNKEDESIMLIMSTFGTMGKG